SRVAKLKLSAVISRDTPVTREENHECTRAPGHSAVGSRQGLTLLPLPDGLCRSRSLLSHNEEERLREMARGAASSTKTSGPRHPSDPPPPRRGAFPTPKAEIEKEKRYIPGTDRASSPPAATDPVLPSTADQKGGSQRNRKVPEQK